MLRDLGVLGGVRGALFLGLLNCLLLVGLDQPGGDIVGSAL